MTQTSLITSLSDVRSNNCYAVIGQEPGCDIYHYIANSHPSKFGVGRCPRLFPIHVDSLGLSIPVNVLHKSLVASGFKQLFGHCDIVATVGG
jgi:hypothetical protein